MSVQTSDRGGFERCWLHEPTLVVPLTARPRFKAVKATVYHWTLHTPTSALDNPTGKSYGPFVGDFGTYPGAGAIYHLGAGRYCAYERTNATNLAMDIDSFHSRNTPHADDGRGDAVQLAGCLFLAGRRPPDAASNWRRI